MSESEAPDVESTPDAKRVKQVVIRMWPKTPILYPMAAVALICGIITQIWGGKPVEEASASLGGSAQYALAQAGSDGETAPSDDAAGSGTDDTPAATGGESTDEPTTDGTPASGEATGSDDEVTPGEAPADDATETEAKPEEKIGSLDRTMACIFLFTMFVSLFTLCVNLDIRWGLIFVSSVVILILIGVIANIYVDFITNFFGFLNYFDPAGNAHFYYGVFVVWGILMIISYIVSRFHYVRIEPNEVVVVGGMLERQQRYSTMRMRYTKEVLDVLEYYLPLVRSGRLILSFPEQNEAVIIDNVLNIKKVTDDLDGLISSLQIVSD